MKSKTLKYASALFLATFIGTLAGLLAGYMPETGAIKATDFKAGRIIDDQVFYNKNTMTVAEIQATLDKYTPSCDMWGTGAVGSGRTVNGKAVSSKTTRANFAKMMREAGNKRYHEPPYVCLNKYYENPETHRNLYDSKGTIEDGMISAAQIIYNYAQKYNVNPQTLIVMLRKESYVWGDNWPLRDEYNTVMGYACPDTAACDTKYYGFANQVSAAAWQINYYREHINSYNYRPYKTNKIQYSPTASCGTKSVYIENYATASLYIYTPYTPNDAALKAYPGTASCGSYGNRNFFMFFNEMFGTTWFAANKVTPFDDGDYRILPQNDIYVKFDESGNDYKFTKNSDSSYSIVNIKTGLALAVDNNSSISETSKVISAQPANTDAQHWFVYENNGKYAFASKVNSLYVLLLNEGKLSLATYNKNNDYQFFYVALPAGEEIEEAAYIIQPFGNSDFAISTANNTKAGLAVQLNKENKAWMQNYYFERDEASGYYVIKNSIMNYAITASKLADGAGISVQNAKSSCEQLWNIIKSDNGYKIYSACSNSLALSITNNAMKAGTNIQLSTNPQVWSLNTMRSVDDSLYQIESALKSGLMLDIKGKGTTIGTNVQVFHNNSGAGQEFEITYDSKFGFYRIVNPNSKLYLATSSYTSGSNVYLNASANNCYSFWNITPVNDGYAFYNTCSSSVLDVLGGKAVDRTNVQVYTPNQSKAQTWKLIDLKPEKDEPEIKPEPEEPEPIVEPEPEIPESPTEPKIITPEEPIEEEKQIVENGQYYITSVLDGAPALDLRGGDTTPGTIAQIWSLSQDCDNQIFEIKYIKDGYYSIKNTKASTYLTAIGTTIRASVYFDSWKDNDTQYWKIVANGDQYDFINMHSGLALDIFNNSNINGTNTQIYTQKYAQKWKLIKYESNQVVRNGNYMIASSQNNKFGIDVKSGSAKDGANAQLWTHSSNNQVFYLKEESNGYYTIRNLTTGTYLTATGKTNRSNVFFNKWTGAASQYWSFVKTGNNFYIVNKLSGLGLDIYNNSIAKGSNIQIYTKAYSQKWTLIKQ